MLAARPEDSAPCRLAARLVASKSSAMAPTAAKGGDMALTLENRAGMVKAWEEGLRKNEKNWFF